MSRTHYWSRLWKVLRGQSAETHTDLANASPADLQSRNVALELDLRDRDDRIAVMRREYEQLQTAGRRDDTGVRQEELERLLKRLAGPLANMLALTAMSRAGREVEVADMLQLVDSLVKELGRAGLEPIGEAGLATTFDVAGHQRLSGGAVQPGSPVVVQIPGFRFGTTVLLKAMVSMPE